MLPRLDFLFSYLTFIETIVDFYLELVSTKPFNKLIELDYLFTTYLSKNF